MGHFFAHLVACPPKVVNIGLELLNLNLQKVNYNRIII